MSAQNSQKRFKDCHDQRFVLPVMMIATIDVMPAPPTPDTILPMMICCRELAVPLFEIRRQFQRRMMRAREVQDHTYETRHPTPNRQYAAKTGILNPKASLVAPYYRTTDP